METLLSSAFDLLSSYDPVLVRKGLRHLEGMLAKLCLAPSTADRDSDSDDPAPVKKPEDPAFREFIKLQSGFEWNVTIRLIACLERLMGKQNNPQTDGLIISCLDLLQGLLLLHPPSRQLFAREIHMNVLIDLLDPANGAPVHCAALLALVSALLGKPENIRTFEAVEGLPTVVTLFKRRDTPRVVKLKCLEFIYFYLMPENPTPPSTPTTPHRGRRRGYFSPMPTRPGSIRTTEEKQKLLGEWLTNVEALVNDLRDCVPFAE